MKKYLLQLIFILIGVTVHSQEFLLMGSVNDSINKDIFPFANVILINNDKNDTLYCTSDIEGIFSFPIKNEGFHTISASYVGYSPYNTIINISKTNNYVSLNMIPNSKMIIDTIYFDLFNKKSALKDIEKNSITILLSGGFIASSTTEADSLFEKKYLVQFLSRGCVISFDDNESEYNQEMFKFLDKRYGKNWRSEIRKDVIGLNR